MFCAKCGTAIRDDMRFCYACGFDVSQSAPPQSPSPRSPGLSGSAPGGVAVAERPARVAAGATIANRYVIERQLGVGGMGMVFLARDNKLNEPVALKVILPERLESRSAMARFMSEARACLKLSHPHVVRVYHLDEWEGLTYMAMEYLDGVTLHSALRQRLSQGARPQWDEIACVLGQVLSAVAYAHDHGIVHRDLKSSNIMLAREGDNGQRAVVMDFGLAKLGGIGRTRIGASLGTPYYMAPEQFSSAAEVDARADVFSLGVIAYELLTGRLPMGAIDPPDAGRNDLPAGVGQWVMRAMRPDPAARFASGGEMLDALSRLCGPGDAAADGADRGGATLAPRGAPAVVSQARGAVGVPGFIERAPLRRGGGGFAVKPAQVQVVTVARRLPPATPREGRRNFAEELGQGVKLDMLWIPAGAFVMGSPEDESGHLSYEGPAHVVELDGFWMGKHPITQAAFEAVMGANPAREKDPRLPVENVNWDRAVEFCERLSATTGKYYRLPTEAQWEYACRAGSETRFYFGESELFVGDYAWYAGNSGRQPHPVGQKKPNAFGLHDMCGNVWEWCRDWFADDYYAQSPPQNPPGPPAGEGRVLRGGSCRSDLTCCRSAFRSWGHPRSAQSRGFRVVRLERLRD